MIAKTMMEEYQNPSIKISDKLKLKNIICTIFKVEWDNTDPCPDLRDTDLRMEYDELSVFAKRITASADASVELPAIINSANLNGCPFTA